MRKEEISISLGDFGIVGGEELYNMQLPNPATMVYYENLKDRKIWLDDTVSEYYMDFIRYIMKWNLEDINIPVESRQPINIYIYTYGGGLDFANALIDIIKMSKTPIYTINMGICMSAGALIFLAGDKRYVMPKSKILIHQGNVNGVSGTTNQVIETVEDIKKTEKEVKQYILEHSKITTQIYGKYSKKEWFLTAKEAIDYGVADEIVFDIDIII